MPSNLDIVTGAFETFLDATTDTDYEVQFDTMTEMVGDPELLNVLLASAQTIVGNRPRLFEQTVASAELRALWMGLVVGACVGRRSVTKSE